MSEIIGGGIDSMGEEQITEKPKKHHRRKKDAELTYYRPSIKRLRFVLMFLLCIKAFGFPTFFGPVVKVICNFVTPAFFLISGYLVLREDEDRSNRILRTIQRTAIVFVAMTVAYMAINYAAFQLKGYDFVAKVANGKFWFDFLVLNRWTLNIGNQIWYVQSILYAYIIIYFLEKHDLLKYDWFIGCICLLFGIITGELSQLFGFNVAGYTYLGGNFITYAIPYLMFGCLLHKKVSILRDITREWYLVGILLGVILVIFEIALLGEHGAYGYYGHQIGFILIAFSACMLVLRNTNEEFTVETKYPMSRWQINSIYYFCQPVGETLIYAIAIFLYEFSDILNGFVGIATFLVCYTIAKFLAIVNKFIKTRYYRWQNNKLRRQAMGE